MNKLSMPPPRQESSVALALLNQRLKTPDYRCTVMDPLNKQMKAGASFGGIAVLIASIDFVGLSAALLLHSVWHYFGWIGMVTLIAVYVPLSRQLYNRVVKLEEDLQRLKSLLFVSFLFVGPLIISTYYITDRLYYRPLEWLIDRLCDYRAHHRWLRDPKQELKATLRTHRTTYPSLELTSENDSDSSVVKIIEQPETLRHKLEIWLVRWNAFNALHHEDPSKADRLLKPAQQLDTQLNNILNNSKQLSDKAQKLYDAADFQLQQVLLARDVLVEPNELKLLQQELEHAVSKLLESIEVLKLTDLAQQQEIHRAELGDFLVKAQNQDYIDRCEKTHDQINDIARQIETAKEQHLDLAS